MKKSIYVLIMALMVGIGAKVEGADRACPTGANLDLFIMSNTTAYTYNSVTYSTANGNAVQDGDVVIVSGACNWSAMINGLPISVTVKADPSLSTRPIITYSNSGTAGYFIKPAPAAGKTIVITFDGVDIVGTSPTPRSATGFINSVPTATGSNTKIVINNCVIRQFATNGFFSTYTANTAGGAPFGDIIITNSRITGFGYITNGTNANTSPANIILTNSYFGTYASASLSFIRTTGTSVQVNHCTFNNVGSGSRVLFNSVVSGTNTINSSVFANCAQTSNNTLTPTATGSGNINLSSSANAITGLPGTLATTPALANGTLPVVASLSTTDSWYYAASGTAGYYNSATYTKSVSTLSGFAYNEGSGPSTASTFTISGVANLFNNLTVAAPANYEVSSDGTTYASSLIFAPALGVVTSKTISVRLVAGLTPASYTGDITLSSANLSNQTIALSGTVSAGGSPAFTASPGSLTGFNYIYNQGPSSEQSFTVSGSNLTANVEIAAPTNYEVSTTSGSGFGTSASIPFGSGTLSAVPVYVRLKAGLNSGSYTAENIALTSGLAVEQGVSCSGTVTPPTITITPTSLTSFFALAGSATPSTEKTFTIGGSNLAGDITITPSTNYEISTATGGSFAATNPITLSPSSGSVASTTIYVRLKGSLATTSYNENITVATAGVSNASVACSGNVATPVVQVGNGVGLDNRVAASGFTYVVGAGPSASQGSTTYVSGLYLQGDVTATAPTNYEVSKDNSTYADFVTYTMSNSNVSGNLYTRLKSGLLTDTYNGGSVTLSSAGAANRLLSVSGSVTGGAVIYGLNASTAVVSTIPTPFTYAGNGPSASSNTIRITCSGLTSDVTVTPSAGFEVSTDGTTFQSTPMAVANDGFGAIAAGTIIYTRMAASLSVGAKTGTITLTATNATTRTVNVSGTVYLTPTVTVTPIGTYTYNGSPQGPTAATNTGTGSSYTFSYAGTGFTTYGPSATLPTASGTYTATATVAANGNYVQASSTATAFSILSTGAVTTAINISDLTLSPSSVITVSSAGSLVLNANTNVSSITVAAGGKLTHSSGTLTIANGITLESDATGTATLMDSYITPTISATVQQYVTAGRNWYMSAPLNAANASVLDKGASVQGYNELTGLWEVASGTLSQGKGYVQVASAGQGTTGTISFAGTTNSGDVLVTLTNNVGGGKGFNLVGNPYPSYLSWSAVAGANTAANMPTGTMWYRTISYNSKNAWAASTFYNLDDIVYNGTRFYKVTTAGISAGSGGPTGGVGTTGIVDNEVRWDYAGSVYVFATISASGVASPASVSNLVPPMQAFWVKSTGGTLTFTNAMRSHETVSNKLKVPKNAADDIKIIRLNVSNGASTDEAVIYINANASNAFDSYDAPKYFNSAGSNQAEIYTQVGSEKLVINAMNEITSGTEIAIGFATEKQNNFSITASELTNFASNIQVILIDKLTKTEFDLSGGSAYSFSSGIVNDATRFSLVFKTKGSITDIKNTEKLHVQVFVNAANQITIIAAEKSDYTIYNAVGQLMENGAITSNSQTSNIKLAAGIYVVKVGNNSARVIIK